MDKNTHRRIFVYKGDDIKDGVILIAREMKKWTKLPSFKKVRIITSRMNNVVVIDKQTTKFDVSINQTYWYKEDR